MLISRVFVFSICILGCSGAECTNIKTKEECKLWAHYDNACVNDRKYMVTNCPVTCSLCGPCSLSPCSQTEKCVSRDTSRTGAYVCLCADGYAEGDCADSPCNGVNGYCLNGGSCIVDFTKKKNYTCDCLSGFTGSRCQRCSDDNPSCSNWAKAGECKKNPTYMKHVCRLSCVDECPDCIRTPCQNGGICDNSDICNCTGTGFRGNYCEVNEKCVPNPCQNGAVCTQTGICDCTNTGFTGEFCTVHEKCVPNPCQNGAVCTQTGTCDCTNTGFTGEFCTVNEKCVPNPCQNGAVCTQTGICDCTNTGFTGEFCTETLSQTTAQPSPATTTIPTSFLPTSTNTAVTTTTTTTTDIVIKTSAVTSMERTETLTTTTSSSSPSTGTTTTTTASTTSTSAAESPTTTSTTEIPVTITTTGTKTASETSSSSLSSKTVTTNEKVTTKITTQTTKQTPKTGCDAGKLGQKCQCSLTPTPLPQEVAKEMAKAQQAATDLKKNLTIQNQTSAQKRTKTSAEDSRPSAQAVGTVGIVMLLLVACLVIVPDLISLGVWLDKTLKANADESLSRGDNVFEDEFDSDTFCGSQPGTEPDKTTLVCREEDQKNNLLHQRNQIHQVVNASNTFQKPLTNDQWLSTELNVMTSVNVNPPSGIEKSTTQGSPERIKMMNQARPVIFRLSNSASIALQGSVGNFVKDSVASRPSVNTGSGLNNEIDTRKQPNSELMWTNV